MLREQQTGETRGGWSGTGRPTVPRRGATVGSGKGGRGGGAKNNATGRGKSVGYKR